MTYEMTFEKGQQVRLVNESRPRRVTHSLLTETGEWYQLNYGGTYYPVNELRVVFNDNRDEEQEREAL